MKSFKQYIIEQKREAVISFMKFNPPTSLHEKIMDTVKEYADDRQYFIYTNKSHDSKKNPLLYEQKIKYARKMFPKHGRNIIMDENINNITDALVSLYEKGYNKVTVVVPDDLFVEYKTLTNMYNGKQGRSGYYMFESGVKIVSVNGRDPDSENVSGASSSKVRAAAANNDFQLFSSAIPSTFKEQRELFNDIRTGLGLTESYKFREHVEFAPVSEQREAYVQGNLFEEGNQIVIKETEEVGEIVRCGSNYVIVKLYEGKVVRKWITDIEKLES